MTHTMSHNRLTPPSPSAVHTFNWTDPVFVVAGGPSLRGFDFERLRGKQVIAINRAHEVCPFAQACYFSDRRFWSWYRESLLNFEGMLIATTWPNNQPFENDAGRLIYFEFTGTKGFESKFPGIRSGNNSGYAGINVGYHLGGRLFVLLGFDMKRSHDGESHYHGGYGVHGKATKDRAWQKMRDVFPSIVTEAAVAGVEIVNATPGSLLDCFDRVDVESYL